MTEDNSNIYARLHLASRTISSIDENDDNTDTFGISVRFCPKRRIEFVVKRGSRAIRAAFTCMLFTRSGV